MSLTQTRINEIALECFDSMPVNVTPEDAVKSYNLFLSRIREEQEAVEYQVFLGGNWVSGGKDGYESFKDRSPTRKLFTTPPAAPCDCSELVEALEESNSLLVKILLGETDLKEIEEQAHDNRTALANHAKRQQKGEE